MSDGGITMNTDISVPLAYHLRRKNTHLVGANQMYLPKNVINTKLKRSEMSVMQTKGLLSINGLISEISKCFSLKQMYLKRPPVIAEDMYT